MELVIGIIVIAVVGYFVFFRKEKDASVYSSNKVETPVADEVVSVTVEGAGQVDISATPVVEAAPAKKVRKPRTPKAEKATPKEAIAKKTAAKKAAVKKPAAMKTTKKSKNA